MKVKDLIERLMEYNPELPVCLDDWSGKWNLPNEQAAELVQVVENGRWESSKLGSKRPLRKDGEEWDFRPNRMTKNGGEKLIGGIPHIQIICLGCKLPIWRSKKSAAQFVCDTCLNSKTEFGKGSGGGIRVIKKGEPLG